MGARASIVMLVAALALAPGPASAKVYTELTPRVSLLGGLDDNVPLNGTSGDYFGRAQPGLKLDIYGAHQMHVLLDCQASLARLGHPDRFRDNSPSDFATGEQCGARYDERLSPRMVFHLRSQVGYMQDPLAISGLGLLLRPGQTHVFQGRLNAEAQLAVSTRAQWNFAVDSQTLDFGPNDPGNGGFVAPSVTYAYRTTPYARWELTGREQLFYAFGASPSNLTPTAVPAGILTEAHSGLAGYVRKVSAMTTLTARGGAAYVTGRGASTVEPIGRIELESFLHKAAVNFLLLHDLAIGASRAGALAEDLAELGVAATAGKFETRLRAGVYRNSPVGNWQLGSMGYSGEADLDFRFAKEWTVGVAALRDARLTDRDVGQQVDRDVVQLRITWERARN